MEVCCSLDMFNVFFFNATFMNDSHLNDLCPLIASEIPLKVKYYLKQSLKTQKYFKSKLYFSF